MIQNLLSYHLAHLCSCHKLPDVFELYMDITISISLALSISLLYISLLQLVSGAQFLNITPFFFSSACLASASSLILFL